ncbi:hypothetical protein AD006_11065 [Pseudonocardia sp. EC080610-09]|nr:hypothetical protein AD006_11065 [Pseudonocardia sp. EC080610-09]ALL84807.1 hypothetical protein AD017_18895 [Pseudonocardia sp. EC080619-01]
MRRASGNLDVHDARAALGARLREVRTAAGLSGRALAQALSWPPSKVSKLENGRQTPTDDDVRGWVRIADAPDDLESLLASLHALELQHSEWRRQLRGGLLPVQQRIRRFDEITSFFRVFEPAVVPGILQTPEYARHRFIESARLFGAQHDLESAVAERVRRQDALYRADKRFHLVVTESALRNRLCPASVLVGQLDRIMTVSMLPAVRLGVLDLSDPCPVVPSHGFWLLDDERVVVETFSAELNLTQQPEIELYREVFEAIAGAARYGRAARQVVHRLAEELADLPDDDPGKKRSESPGS